MTKRATRHAALHDYWNDVRNKMRTIKRKPFSYGQSSEADKAR